jgi:hypothetical protein
VSSLLFFESMGIGYKSFVSLQELRNQDRNHNQRFFFLIFSRINDFFEVPIRICMDFMNKLNFFQILETQVQDKVEKFPSQTVSDSFAPL